MDRGKQSAINPDRPAGHVLLGVQGRRWRRC
jgi:hypothetical protein